MCQSDWLVDMHLFLIILCYSLIFSILMIAVVEKLYLVNICIFLSEDHFGCVPTLLDTIYGWLLNVRL